MAAFTYTAINTDGRQRKGVLDADSARHARQLLRDKGLVPMEVGPAVQTESSGKSRGFSFGRNKLKVADLALITRQLATLVQASIPLEEALATVARQSDNAKVNGILMAVRGKVLEGHTLADAMSDFPNAFSDLYRSTVRAGESAGHLDAVLEKLADYTESAHASRQKVQMAMIYPSILFFMAIAVVALLMVFVVPDVVKVFNTQGASLPLITRIMIAISDFVTERGLMLVIGLVIVIVLVQSLLRRPAYKLAWHRQLLSFPLVGRLARGTNTAQFASTLSILTASGVPLVEALKIGGQVLANHWLRKVVAEATQQVQEGSSLNQSLAKGGYFPPMMLHMIASGEQSGELDQMLARTATAQQRDLESTIGVILGVLEPMMLLFMGVCVFVIVLAILLPIVNLNTIV